MDAAFGWEPFLNRFWLFWVQAFQKPPQLLSGYLSCFIIRPRPLKPPAFVPFVQKAETIPFIVDCFDPVGPSAAEQE